MMASIEHRAQTGPFRRPRETRFRATVQSPLGALSLLSDGEALTGLYLPTNRRRPPILATLRHDRAPFSEAIRQIEAYFDHDLRAFTLPLAPQGTLFQVRVWQALLTVPYGETKSYGEIAQLLGDPKAARAVGHANANNPLALIVPCHRVIGSSGQLIGYASGLEQKKWLLTHEASSLSANTRMGAALAPHRAPQGAGG